MKSRGDDRKRQRPPEHDQAAGPRAALRAAASRSSGSPYAEAGNATLARVLAARVLASSGAGLLPGGRVHPGVEALIHRRRGGGSSLDGRIRAKLEPTVGELGDVRVHDDGTADALARSVSARAFTTGRDVFFARGEYRPGTVDGDRLLAHELTHVSQQRGAPLAGRLEVTDPGDSFEREAERAARGWTG